MPGCLCSGRCRKPPYTCSGQPKPDFLTEKQRRAHDRAFLRGETNFRTPFEPWVVRSWARHLDETGGFDVADRIRKNILDAIDVANAKNLSTRQKIKRIRKKI